MGATNDFLIPPAILLDNLGITVDQFVEKLSQTKCGEGSLGFRFTSIWLEAPWDECGEGDDKYHQGKEGLAEILGLKKDTQKNEFDFSQERGTFHPCFMQVNRNPRGYFGWIQRKGKYYLDESRMEKLPLTFQDGQSGLTDLILTAEAIKHKAWKLLSYHGYERSRTIKFLQDFPDSAQRYLQCLYDFYSRETAKKEKMTNKEYMRFRLLHPPNNDVGYDYIKQIKIEQENFPEEEFYPPEDIPDDGLPF